MSLVIFSIYVRYLLYGFCVNFENLIVVHRLLDIFITIKMFDSLQGTIFSVQLNISSVLHCWHLLLLFLLSQSIYVASMCIER